ncbi:unnamed protein product, partial [Amoebophrya sp. A120]
VSEDNTAVSFPPAGVLQEERPGVRQRTTGEERGASHAVNRVLFAAADGVYEQSSDLLRHPGQNATRISSRETAYRRTSAQEGNMDLLPYGQAHPRATFRRSAHYGSKKKSRTRFEAFGELLFQASTAIVQSNWFESAHSAGSKVIQIGFAFVSLIFVAAYTATLSAMLAFPEPPPTAIGGYYD